MTNLFPDTPCPACGRSHTLYHRNDDNHPYGAVYSYTCPTTKVVVSFRPAKPPEPVILAPSLALPMTWVAD